MTRQISVMDFNENTGEIFFNSTKNKPYKIWKENVGAMIKCRNRHKKIYNDYKLCDIIEDKNDLLKTYILMEYIYNDNIIYINVKNKTYKPATSLDISEILGITEKTAKEYLNRMIKRGILGKIVVELNDENKYDSYAFNPVFVNSCKYIKKDLYLLFKDYIDKYLPDWIKQKYLEIS